MSRRVHSHHPPLTHTHTHLLLLTPDFEHVTLPRYIVQPKTTTTQKKKNCLVRAGRRVFCKGNQQLDRAEPGERSVPTALYSPVFTPHTQLGDWGLGVGYVQYLLLYGSECEKNIYTHLLTQHTHTPRAVCIFPPCVPLRS